MTKTPGWKTKGFVQMKDLRAKLLNDDKDIASKERTAGASRIDDAMKRKLTKEQQRKADSVVMAKSLVRYPSNPMPRAGIWNAADHVRSAPKSEAGKPKSRKHANLAPDNTHAQAKRAQRKAALRLAKDEKKLAREEARAKKLEVKVEARRIRDEKKVANKAEKEQRSAERARMAKLPSIKPTQEIYDNVMNVIKAQFKMSAKKEEVWRKFLTMYADLAPKQQANRWHLIELRFAVMQAYKIEVDAQIKAMDAGLDAQAVLQKVYPEYDANAPEPTFTAVEPKGKVAKKATKKSVASKSKTTKKLVAKGSFAKSSRTMK